MNADVIISASLTHGKRKKPTRNERISCSLVNGLVSLLVYSFAYLVERGYFD